MRKVILFVFILFLAGCKTTELKEIPVAQVVSQKVETMSPMEELPVIQMVEEVKEREKFYSLSVRDMALRNVLFMFSKELPEYNMVVDPDVAGVVTLNFRDLPLDKALEIILDPLGLEYTIEDNILRVSNPRMITRTFEFVYTTSVRTSSSTVRAVTGAGEAESASFGSVSVEETVDVWTELGDGIRQLMSTGPTKLTINKRVGYITITDYRSNIKAVEEYIDLFKKSVKTQIHIRAKLLEVTLKEGSEFGIDWTGSFKKIGIVGAGNSNPVTFTQSFAPSGDPPTGESRTGDIASLFELGITHRDLNTVVRALQSTNTIKILSAPEVSILNGQKAILSSVTQDVYFESSQSAGTGGNPITTTTANTFTFGVYLDVTPYVDSEGMITMEIHPSVSSFIATRTSSDPATGSPLASRPAIDTRETQTIVTIKEGEVIIIAGLMKNEIKVKVSKIPLLGDIPYLGKLFRRELKSDVKTELVILISATIIGPRAKDFGNIRAKYKMLKNQFP